MCFSLISDTKKSYCPKCHPYIAGCIVVVIFLFTMYHANDIKLFTKSLFRQNPDPSDSSVTSTNKHPKFKAAAYTNDDSTVNSAEHKEKLSILLMLTLTTLPHIF